MTEPVQPKWEAVPWGIKLLAMVVFFVAIAVGNFLIFFWPIILLIAIWQFVTTPLRAIGDAIEARTIGRLAGKFDERFGAQAEVDEGAQLAVLYWLKWPAIAGLVAGVGWGMIQSGGIPYINGQGPA